MWWVCRVGVKAGGKTRRGESWKVRRERDGEMVCSEEGFWTSGRGERKEVEWKEGS